MDPLLFQVIWLAIAFGIGLGLQQAVGVVAEWLSASGPNVTDTTVDSSKDGMLREKLTIASVIGSFPLFIYTLFGGAIVRWALRMVGQVQRIDVETIHRLVGTSMDLLVVAAVATLNLSVVASMWVPFSLLFVAGAIWSTLCLLVLSRWILRPEFGFQLGLINYGMSTGTTATGFVLLRVVDPDLGMWCGGGLRPSGPAFVPLRWRRNANGCSASAGFGKNPDRCVGDRVDRTRCYTHWAGNLVEQETIS